MAASKASFIMSLLSTLPRRGWAFSPDLQSMTLTAIFHCPRLLQAAALLCNGVSDLTLHTLATVPLLPLLCVLSRHMLKAILLRVQRSLQHPGKGPQRTYCVLGLLSELLSLRALLQTTLSSQPPQFCWFYRLPPWGTLHCSGHFSSFYTYVFGVWKPLPRLPSKIS